jgi:hypothetical protein
MKDGRLVLPDEVPRTQPFENNQRGNVGFPDLEADGLDGVRSGLPVAVAFVSAAFVGLSIGIVAEQFVPVRLVTAVTWSGRAVLCRPAVNLLVAIYDKLS